MNAQSITFVWDGSSHEARVDPVSVPRSSLTAGQLVVTQPSGDYYAIFIDIRDGEHVASPVNEDA